MRQTIHGHRLSKTTQMDGWLCVSPRKMLFRAQGPTDSFVNPFDLCWIVSFESMHEVECKQPFSSSFFVNKCCDRALPFTRTRLLISMQSVPESSWQLPPKRNSEEELQEHWLRAVEDAFNSCGGIFEVGFDDFEKICSPYMR